MADLTILRRIADRGQKAAQKAKLSEKVDLWQHLLDELSRINS